MKQKNNLCSYRTYEEWKLSSVVINIITKISSYRTYEEWKPPFFLFFRGLMTSSYRTYEEWKLHWIENMRVMRVLTVPMRNGNQEGE